MAKPGKVEKSLAYLAIRSLALIRLRWGVNVMFYFYQKWGMKFEGRPNYIAVRSDIDGTDFSLLTIGEGVTISSYVRVLTHDWCPHTVAKAMGIVAARPLGRIEPVSIGAFSFIGTGSIVMPGSKIGRGCIIGAGTVVRGTIPDFSIVIGSPGKIVGDSRDYIRRLAEKSDWDIQIPSQDPTSN